MAGEDEQVTVSLWAIRFVIRAAAVIGFGLGAAATAILPAVFR